MNKKEAGFWWVGAGSAPKNSNPKLFWRRSSALVSALSLFCLFSEIVYAGETIVTHETDRYFYKDGRMVKLDNQFEVTYFLDLDKDTLTRTRVYDFLNNKITPDETVYHLERQMLSHPSNSERYILKPVIRAIAQPGADSMELLVIEEKAVESVTSTADELLISRGKRIR